jgi:hypothetical protein
MNWIILAYDTNKWQTFANMIWNLWFYTISWLSEELLASQKGLYCVVLAVLQVVPRVIISIELSETVMYRVTGGVWK